MPLALHGRIATRLGLGTLEFTLPGHAYRGVLALDRRRRRAVRALDQRRAIASARSHSGRWSRFSIIDLPAASIFGPPPPSPAAIAWSAQSMWLLVAWGYWVDSHRCGAGNNCAIEHTEFLPQRLRDFREQIWISISEIGLNFIEKKVCSSPEKEGCSLSPQFRASQRLDPLRSLLVAQRAHRLDLATRCAGMKPASRARRSSASTAAPTSNDLDRSRSARRAATAPGRVRGRSTRPGRSWITPPTSVIMPTNLFAAAPSRARVTAARRAPSASRSRGCAARRCRPARRTARRTRAASRGTRRRPGHFTLMISCDRGTRSREPAAASSADPRPADSDPVSGRSPSGCWSGTSLRDRRPNARRTMMLTRCPRPAGHTARKKYRRHLALDVAVFRVFHEPDDLHRQGRRAAFVAHPFADRIAPKIEFLRERLVHD